MFVSFQATIEQMRERAAFNLQFVGSNPERQKFCASRLIFTLFFLNLKTLIIKWKVSFVQVPVTIFFGALTDKYENNLSH